MSHALIQRSAIVAAMCLSTTAAAFADTYVLSCGKLRVEIDTATDRLTDEFGPRFDRTAVVSSITVDGHEVLGTWGLCDEFGLYGNGVLGYERAGVGGEFVKIGVGRLLRDTDALYHFAHPYPISELFPVAVEANGTQLVVTQDSGPGFPERYLYQKTYILESDNALSINYQLSNLGADSWTFEHYNHHWFRLRDIEPGPGYRVVTDFKLPAAETSLLLGENSLGIRATFNEDEAAYYASDLASVEAAANAFALAVDDSEIVHYQGSFPPARLALYANGDGVCPEIFKRSFLGPGETRSWSATYRFTAPRHAPAGD
jgi:hypothetical protein